MVSIVSHISPDWIRNGAQHHVERVRSVSGILRVPGRALAPLGRGRPVYRFAQAAGDGAADERAGAGGGDAQFLRATGGGLVPPRAELIRSRPENPVSLARRHRLSVQAYRTGARLAAPVPAGGTASAWMGLGAPKAVARGASPSIGGEPPKRRQSLMAGVGWSLAPPAPVVPYEGTVAERSAIGQAGSNGFSAMRTAATGTGVESANPSGPAGGLLDGQTGGAAAGGSGSGRPNSLGSTVHIDGAALGRWTIEHLSRALARPAMGMTSIDPRSIMPRSRIAPF